jgi:hypothetical protein
MVGALGEHSGDDAALLGDPKAAFGAEGFEVDWLIHV